MGANPKPRPDFSEENSDPRNNNSCEGTIDRNAPAGSRNSLGGKSDCNGRPSSDDSVVEAMDEPGPLKTPPGEESSQ